MVERADIVVVGAGAAGLTAGIFAGEAAPTGSRIVLLDGASRIGAKILVAGGGRCNVTHDHVTPEDYHGSHHVVRNVLRAFDEEQTVYWFASMGVELKREDTGKLFPVTDQARTVLDALLGRCAELAVEVRTGCRVRSIARDGEAFRIAFGHGEVSSRRVVLCTGGRSLPRTGSDGFGYELARRLGHTITPTAAALVPLVLDPRFFHTQVQGLTLDLQLTSFADGKLLERRVGSLLFTHFGISGPVAMDISGAMLLAKDAGRPVELRCSFLPDRAFEQVERELVEQAQRQPRRPVAAWLSDALPRRLAEALLAHVRVAPDLPLGQLPRDDRRQLVHALTDLPLPVTDHRGWNYAEVTTGGVPLDEVDHRTLASRRCTGLHLAGEILDCDGRIGGFNFQWAWATGHLAGTAAAAGLTPDT